MLSQKSQNKLLVYSLNTAAVVGSAWPLFKATEYNELLMQVAHLNGGTISGTFGNAAALGAAIVGLTACNYASNGHYSTSFRTAALSVALSFNACAYSDNMLDIINRDEIDGLKQHVQNWTKRSNAPQNLDATFPTLEICGF